MRVELHNGLKGAENLKATRVIVFDEYDNPIAVVVQIDGGQYVAATAANKQFKSLLNALGITQTLVVEHLDTKKLKQLDI